MMDRITKNNGVTVVAAMIAVMLLAAMGLGLAYFAASNQQTRVQQVTGDQAFYSVQAGLEYALGKVLKEGAMDASFSVDFVGEPISIVRSGGKMTSTASKKDARSTHAIADPSPPVGCLNADVTGARMTSGGKRLSDIYLSRNPSCTNTLIITSMTGTTWTPDNGELLQSIKIEGPPSEFSGPPAGSGGIFDFGVNDFVISDNSQYNISSMDWNTSVAGHSFQLYFNYTYNGTNYTKVVLVNLSGTNQADCFGWETSNARLSVDSGRWQLLTGTTIGNSCASVIKLEGITMSWIPAGPARNFAEFRVAGNPIFSGSAGSGVLVPLNYSMGAMTTLSVDWFKFSNEMLGPNYSVTWSFGDGSSKTTTLDLFNSNEQNCLNINTAQAKREQGDLTKVSGLTIENICAADIGMTDLVLSWTANPSRRLIESSIDDVDGTNIYTSSAASGVLVSLGDNDLYLPSGIGIKNLNYLKFNQVIPTNSQFTLVFTMADASTKSVTFSVESQAQYLTVNTSGATIGGSGNRELQGVTLTNSGTAPMVWTRTIMSWIPTSPTRIWQSIRVEGSNIWTGSLGSGGSANNDDITINAGQTVAINRFRFNSNVQNRTFTITFLMGDGSQKTTPAFTPP